MSISNYWGPNPKDETAHPSFQEVALEGASHDYYNEIYPAWACDTALNLSDWLDLSKVACSASAAHFEQINTEVARVGNMLSVQIAGVDGDYRKAARIAIDIDTDILETILHGVAVGAGLAK